MSHDQDWHQFDTWDYGKDYISFEHRQLASRFVVLANEVMWQLIMEGVITPGFDASNRELPWFRVTDYGRQVLKAERFIPHDPTGYLSDLQTAAKTTMTKVAIAYVEESLRCFNRGCHVAAVLLLGVAAEGVFIELSSVVRASLRSSADQKTFDKLPDHVRPKHRWIVQKYSTLPASAKKQLPESLDMTLSSLGDLIRRQRNELGHPQTAPPQITREQAFIAFHLFPTFVSDIESFVGYCQANGL